MNIKQKKEELLEALKKNQPMLNELQTRQQQIIGQLQLLEEMEKEEKNKVK